MVKKTPQRKRVIQKRKVIQTRAKPKQVKARPLKLTIELVPTTSWYNNLRKVIPTSEWDKLRKRVYAQYGYRCGICGAEGRLNCHEIWEYDDHNHVQKLAGFIALCDWCHHVKHLGFAAILSKRGELDYEKVIEHFMKVNECDRQIFQEQLRKASTQHLERSKHDWHVDFGEYQNLVQGQGSR
jgi:hypothetical protein